MKRPPKKVYIIVNNKYVAITNEEHEKMKNTNKDYAAKYFIPLQGYLVETDKENYTGFYKYNEHLKYLKKCDIKQGLLSIDALDTESSNGIDFISLKDDSMENHIINQLMIEKLRFCIKTLPDDEKEIIRLYFYEGVSQTELGEILGLNQSNISRKIVRILEKLKKML